jgi:hypothetical protein
MKWLGTMVIAPHIGEEQAENRHRPGDVERCDTNGAPSKSGRGTSALALSGARSAEPRTS